MPHRLRQIDPVSINEDFVRRRFIEAVRVVTERLGDTDATRDQFSLQHSPVNMLELAAYFLDLPLDPLEGLRDEEDPGGSHWRLVGPDPRITSVRYAREFALEELDERQAADDGAFVFCLPEAPDSPWWRTRPGAKQDPLGENTARILSPLLDRRRGSASAVCNRA